MIIPFGCASILFLGMAGLYGAIEFTDRISRNTKR